MQRILRSLTLLAALLAVTVGLAACGDDAKVDESTDVNTLLEETFSGEKRIDSGIVDVKIKLDVKGGQSGVSGPVDIRLAGPFQSHGKKKLPELDLELKFSGAGQNLEAGITILPDKGYVNFQGADYVLSDQVFDQIKTQVAQQPDQKDDKNTSLATLGIDPRKWLTDAKNAGDAKVGETDTVKITGGVDVGKLLDDINTALGKAASLGLSGTGQVPTRLTEEQKAQVEKAVKDVGVEIYTGKDDTTLRRMLVNMGVDAEDGGEKTSGTLTLDFQLLDLNEDQSIDAPANPKPFDQLLGQLGGLGLGGAGSGGSGSGSGSGSGGASAEDLKKYSDCVTEAGSDTAKAQKCAELLSP